MFVSGEVRLLDEGGETRRLLLALEALVSSVSPAHFALIGGLAVMARLGQAHRGTQDIDTAVDQEGTIPSPVIDRPARQRRRRSHASTEPVATGPRLLMWSRRR